MPPSGSSDVANECRPLGSIPSGLFRPLDWTNSFTNSVNFLRLWARRDIALCCCCAESTQCAPEQITKTQWHQKTRLPKNDKRKGRMLGNQLNASQSCFCSDCNSSSRVLTCGVGNYSLHVWCLRVAVGKTKYAAKTKNHWPDLMVSSLHDYWKVLRSYSDCVKTGRAQFHWTLNRKSWNNERLEFPQFFMRWPQLLIKQTHWQKPKAAKPAKSHSLPQNNPKQSRLGFVAT